MSKVIEVISSVLDTSVDIESNMENTEEWDSFAHVLIMIELISEFELEINQEDFQELLSVKRIIELVENNKS
jgi:acyl carrier protein